MHPPSLIFVTGATGFVGGPLVRELVGRGHAVRAHARVDSPDLIDLGAAEVSIGDLMDPHWFDTAVAGVERVIHTAGISHRVAADDDHYAVNRDAALALARAAAAAGVRRFVFVSSVAVYGHQSWDATLDEGSPTGGEDIDAYGRAKLEAEEGLREIARRTSMEVTIARPPLVYGANAKGNLLRLVRLADSPLPLPLARATAGRSMISVTNLVDFLIRAADHLAAAGETFVITDGRPLSVAELAREFKSLLGRRAILLPVPESLLYWPARLIGRGGEVRLLFGALRFDGSRARRMLDWEPPQPKEAGLEEMVRAYRAQAAAGAAA